jgi:hypothetical protein
LIRKLAASHSHAARRTTLSAVARHVALAAWFVAWCASDASAARRQPEAPVSGSAPSQSLDKPKAKANAKASKPSRKTHRKTKAARRSEVFYRWSDEQLMLGGISPSRIGKHGNDANGKQTSEGAASAK